MSLRRFEVLMGGLSPQSLWVHSHRSAASGPRVVKGADADAYLRSLVPVKAA